MVNIARPQCVWHLLVTLQSSYVLQTFSVKQSHIHTSIRADSRYVPRQSETALLCNDVSHWLGTSLESALSMTENLTEMKHQNDSFHCGHWLKFHQHDNLSLSVAPSPINICTEYDQNCRLHWNILSSLMDRLHCELVNGVKINYVNSLWPSMPWIVTSISLNDNLPETCSIPCHYPTQGGFTTKLDPHSQ